MNLFGSIISFFVIEDMGIINISGHFYFIFFSFKMYIYVFYFIFIFYFIYLFADFKCTLIIYRYTLTPTYNASTHFSDFNCNLAIKAFY